MKVLLLALTMTSCFAFAQTEIKEFDAQGMKVVSIKNTSGKVSLKPTTGAKAIVAIAKNKFSDSCKMTVEKTSNTLWVEVKSTSILSDTCDVDFDIQVPKEMDMNLAVGSGNLKIEGLEGALIYKIGSGEITADGTFRSVDGKSGSGNVDVKGLTGGGEIKTGSGEVNLKFTSAPVNGIIDLKTGSGDAKLYFPKTAKIKTSFAAGSGELSNELGETADASFKVSMKAGSGDLNIKTY
jgi:DUF4097 and DUF4098 domain-containing protein YvlB